MTNGSAGIRRSRLRARYGHLWFVLPGFLVFCAFLVYPMLTAFRLSVLDWRGLGNESHFVGLANFSEALTSPTFWRAAGHNVVFFLAILMFQHTVGLFLAVQLNARPRFMEVYRTILFLPVILSLVATGFIWTLILSPNIGILDPLLTDLGLDFLAKPWLDDVSWALPSVIAVQAWNHLGWAIVIYLSGLQGVPRELREAAHIDGANAWQRFWRVSFPLLAPAFTSLTVITFIQNIRVFDVVYVMAGPIGAPAGRTDVLGTLIYRTAFGAAGITSADVRMSYAVAITVLVFVFMLTAATAMLYGLRRREVEA
ncbi:MAG TPA: sugar ABC transporter permease [Acetobacteraceae bacterium]|nr:sugar ABC transporter permease [Acetobacteraceae bacterium]